MKTWILILFIAFICIGATTDDPSGCAALQESMGCEDAGDDGDDGGGGGGVTAVPPYILFSGSHLEVGAEYFPYVKGTINLTGRVWNDSFYMQSLWENVYFLVNSTDTFTATSNDGNPPSIQPYFAASLNTTLYAATEGSISVIMHANSAVNGTEADSDPQVYLIDNTPVVVTFVSPSTGTVSGQINVEFTLDDPVSWVDYVFEDSGAAGFTRQWSGVQSSGTFTHSFDSTSYDNGAATIIVYGDDRFEVYFEETLNFNISNP